MRKVIAGFLVFSLLQFPAQIANSASSIEKTKCTDLHYMKVSGNTKFECLKVNGKQIWTKFKPLNTPIPNKFPWWNAMLSVRKFNQTPQKVQSVEFFPSPNVPDSEMKKFNSIF